MKLTAVRLVIAFAFCSNLIAQDAIHKLLNQVAVLEKAGETGAAIAELDKAIESKVDSPVLLRRRALLWIRTGNPGKALRDLQQVDELKPSSAGLELAFVAELVGNTKQAKEAFLNVIKHRGDNASEVYRAAAHYALLERMEGRASVSADQLPYTVDTLCKAYFKFGLGQISNSELIEAAIAHSLNSVQKDFALSEVYFLLAENSIAQHAESDAISWLDKIAALKSPDDFVAAIANVEHARLASQSTQPLLGNGDEIPKVPRPAAGAVLQSLPNSSNTLAITAEDLPLLIAVRDPQSKGRVGWDTLLSMLSPEYRSATDEFSRHDIAERIKPAIEKRMHELKSFEYFSFGVECEIGEYDFSRQQFPISISSLAFLDPRSRGGVVEMAQSLGFSNKLLDTSRLPVPLLRARTFSSDLSSSRKGHAFVVARVDETPSMLGGSTIVFSVVRLKISTNTGRTIGEKDFSIVPRYPNIVLAGDNADVILSAIKRCGDVRAEVGSFRQSIYDNHTTPCATVKLTTDGNSISVSILSYNREISDEDKVTRFTDADGHEIPDLTGKWFVIGRPLEAP